MFTSALRKSASRTLVIGAVVATALSTAACEDPPGPSKLFEEDGAWELSAFALSGSGLMQVDGFRTGEILMKFDEENMVVQTAMCSNVESDGPGDIECEGVTDSQWFCQCFGYDFEEDQMAWQAFEAGSTPPMVKIGEVEQGDAAGAEAGSGGDTDTDSGGGEDSGGEPPPAGGIATVTVAEIAGQNATFDFTPLPVGVFGSDGVSSKFVFVKKAASVFDVVLEGTEIPTCQPCV